jgi:hypothetical protein
VKANRPRSRVSLATTRRYSLRLDSDRKAHAGIGLRAFESAHIITRCGRFDLGQPHGVPAFGAREDSDFSTTMEWIGLGGWHDARLRSGGSAKLSVTGNCRQGAVMEPACSPNSGAAGQYCSLFQIVRRRMAPTRGDTLRSRVTARDIRNRADHIWVRRHWSVLNTLWEFRWPIL